MSESLNIQVHPLVVMNLSDHFTSARYRHAAKEKTTRVVGIILGRQTGRTVELVNSIEIMYEIKDGKLNIDTKFAQDRCEQYKIKYGDLDAIGWYSAKGLTASTGEVDATFQKADEPTADDLRVHKTVIGSFLENPLLLLLNPHSKSAKEKKKIPFFLYEADQMGQKFTSIDFLFASSDSEQIAVDGVARAVDPDAKQSTASQQMVAPINAVMILRGKINFIIQAVKNSKEVRANHDFMRRLNQIVSNTPITAAADYDKQSFIEYSDIQTLELMASVTKSCGQIQELIDDFKVIQKGSESHGRFGGGRRGFGAMHQ